MRKPTKKELLEKYRTREPKLFVQVDAFKMTGDEDNLMQPDGDGFWFQARHTYELMEGVDVRILINPKADRKDIIRMLEKMRDRIDQDWPQLLEEARDELERTHGIDGIAESLIRIRGFQLNDFERLIRTAKEKLDEKSVKSDDECPFW
ncbi:MAG: hypothetical protein A2156_13500 [Deltaproteobacteria bacterium RBG_16_48_10]|nr:MAG: hypothetical protein A2156_13500 [Deltaproteobacteria bacterium RBG_16_48_10]